MFRRRLANLAFLERTAPVPRGRRAPEMALEGAREFRGPGEPGLERYVGDALPGRSPQQERGSLQPHAAHVSVQRLAGDAVKDAVEMEWGETADARELGQGQLAVEMVRDVVEHAVHPIPVVLVAAHEFSDATKPGGTPSIEESR